MIYSSLTVTVSGGQSKINERILLYRGDREIQVSFEIIQSAFKFAKGENIIDTREASTAQLIIDKPDGTHVFSEVTQCEAGKVVFTITAEMIDELKETGLYTLQIRLFDETSKSRITLPPIEDAIEVREPIAAEDETNIVDIALVDYSVVKDDPFEDLIAFLPNGDYNRTDWESGDIISKPKLNKIEDALYAINDSNIDNTNNMVDISDRFKIIEDGVKVNTNNMVDISDRFKIIEDGVKVFPLLDKEVELMAIYDIDMSLFNLKEPYCSVDRYGGDNTGKRCSSDSIQIAVDMAEYLCQNDFLNNPITFGSGVYKMTKTVLIKKSMEDTLKETPIVIKGSCSRIHTHSSTGHTAIRVEIPNHVGKDYANVFAINVSYSDFYTRDTEIDDFVYNDSVTTDGGFELFPIINHIEFRDLAFYVERTKFNVNIIKGYRYRSKVTNIEVNGANRLIYQPAQNANGNGNYCDFSHYSNLNFNYMKKNGLELSNPDNSIIEEITCHRLGKDATELIRIVDGGAFKISRVHYAYSFEEGTTTPRNDGSGENGNSCIILLNGCVSAKIENMYIERSLKDYVIRLYNTKNIEISNTSEMFLGNGFVKIDQKCDGINIHDIYRNCNLVSDYKDIFATYSSSYSNLRITNFFCRDYYDVDMLSLEFNAFDELQVLDKSFNNYRKVQHNLDLVSDDKIHCDELTLNLSYYDGILYVKNAKHEDLSYSAYFSDDGILTLDDYIVGVTPSISSNSSLIPYICCVNSANRKEIIFVDTTTNDRITAPSNRVRCDVRIRTLNKYMFKK